MCQHHKYVEVTDITEVMISSSNDNKVKSALSTRVVLKESYKHVLPLPIRVVIDIQSVDPVRIASELLTEIIRRGVLLGYLEECTLGPALLIEDVTHGHYIAEFSGVTLLSKEQIEKVQKESTFLEDCIDTVNKVNKNTCSCGHC